jgi:hypothetical protein
LGFAYPSTVHWKMAIKKMAIKMWIRGVRATCVPGVAAANADTVRSWLSRRHFAAKTTL